MALKNDPTGNTQIKTVEQDIVLAMGMILKGSASSKTGRESGCSEVFVNEHRNDFLYAYWLGGLLALFSLRVVGHLVQVIYPVAFLPDLASWQGSGIIYPVLLMIQVVIMAVVGLIAYRISRGDILPHKYWGQGLLIIGAVYFTVMFVRLILGLSVLAHYSWFAKPIPAFFHLVLAGMVLTIGHYHWRYAR